MQLVRPASMRDICRSGHDSYFCTQVIFVGVKAEDKGNQILVILAYPF
jgi:hypothetical protein